MQNTHWRNKCKMDGKKNRQICWMEEKKKVKMRKKKITKTNKIVKKGKE